MGQGSNGSERAEKVQALHEQLVRPLVLIVLANGATFVGDLTGGGSIAAKDVIVLALIPLALTILATWVARTAVLAALRQAL